MLKQIPVSSVVLGMYIHELCGSWMDHPFWKTGFLLDNPTDLQRLRQSSVTEVWIDVSKGLDAHEGVTQEQANQRAQSILAAANKQTEQSDLVSELQRAANICERSRDAVVSMFTDVRMGKAVDIQQVETALNEMTESVMRHPGALISLARLKQVDEYTYMHSVAVSALMMALARQMQHDEEQMREAGLAGLLHDLGKMAIPESILNKPTSLTDTEFDRIRMHPLYGARYLKSGISSVSREVQDACLHHHEKIDGSGYPHKLTHTEISLLSRMTAVCDVYDAVTSDRPYKKGWGPAEAIQRMAQWHGHFDPQIFQAFVRTVGIYPIGSLVRLASGRLGVVIEQDQNSLLKPKVKVFFSSKSKVPVEQEVIDLASSRCNEEIVARERVEDWGFKNFDQLWME
ncbi:MAG: HD-GYP domain-containing protein [Thiopseudomonas sp.]|nr:HD-GYP domain-containing protein [Thiopseudomonas sp.]MCK9465170.1 HD-GYP domain-containing protein [Thiopseudomonas sp.]